jgi:hypothetical protein
MKPHNQKTIETTKSKLIKSIASIAAVAILTGTAFYLGTRVEAGNSTTGVLPVSKGGTGQTTLGTAANSLLGSNFANFTNGMLPESKGGTGISDLSAKYSKLASPAFTGNPTAPTVASTDNSTNLATTAYVKSLQSTWFFEKHSGNEGQFQIFKQGNMCNIMIHGYAYGFNTDQPLTIPSGYRPLQHGGLWIDLYIEGTAVDGDKIQTVNIDGNGVVTVTGTADTNHKFGYAGYVCE